MRHRQKGSRTAPYVVYTHTNPGGGTDPAITVTYEGSTAQSDLESVHDVVVPGFLKRRAAGDVLMNPFDLTKEKISTSPQSWTVGPHVQWGTRVHTGTPLGKWVESINSTPPAWFEQRITDAMSRTLLSAHSRVAAANFQGLVTVAESKKTAAMIARPLARANELMTRFFQRKADNLRRNLLVVDAIVAAWNEYRFGWKPILYELEGIKDAYIANTEQEIRPVRLVARAGDKSISWTENSVHQGSGPFASGWTISANMSREASVSSGVLYELQDESLQSATARRMGFRLSDVPSTIWELVPYSFIIDRFLDVGMWLNAIVPKPGVKILGSWTTTTRKQKDEYKVVSAFTTVSTSVTTNYPHHQGATLSAKSDRVVRVANPMMPLLPTVNYRDLSLVQHIDHVALITQQIRKFWRP